jgi:hypothetical protein
MIINKDFTPIAITLVFETEQEYLSFKAMCNWGGVVEKVVDGNVDADDGLETVIGLNAMLGAIHHQLSK